MCGHPRFVRDSYVLWHPCATGWLTCYRPTANRDERSSFALARPRLDASWPLATTSRSSTRSEPASPTEPTGTSRSTTTMGLAPPGKNGSQSYIATPLRWHKTSDRLPRRSRRSRAPGARFWAAGRETSDRRSVEALRALADAISHHAGINGPRVGYVCAGQGADARIRTENLPITSRMRCQLRHAGRIASPS